MRNVIPSCLALAVSAGALAQTTHLVGPNGLPEIRDALAIAGAGDIIQVEAGTYAQFEANVGVTIRALVPGTVDIAFTATVLPPNCINMPACASQHGPSVVDVPAGQTVHLVSLRFVANQVIGFGTMVSHSLSVRGGTATIDDCEIRSLGPQALMVTNSSAYLQDCVVAGEGTVLTSRGLVGVNANITAVDCEFLGSQTGIGLSYPGEAIQLTNGWFHGSNLLARGGRSVPGNVGSTAIVASGGALTITDSALEGGPYSCPIQKTGSAPQLGRCTVIAQSFNCQQVTLNPALLAVHRTVPPQTGSYFNLQFRTAPNAFVGIFASHGLSFANLPGLAQPIWLDQNGAFATNYLLAGSQGFTGASWLIPANPALIDQSIWFQAFAGLGGPFGIPLQSSPVAGGVIR